MRQHLALWLLPLAGCPAASDFGDYVDGPLVELTVEQPELIHHFGVCFEEGPSNDGVNVSAEAKTGEEFVLSASYSGGTVADMGRYASLNFGNIRPVPKCDELVELRFASLGELPMTIEWEISAESAHDPVDVWIDEGE